MSHHSDQSPRPITGSSFDTVNRRYFTVPLSRYLRQAGIFGVRSLDLALRFWLGIREFSRRSDCILRVSETICDKPVILGEDFVVRRGDRILELHFWNEHLVHCRGPHDLFGWALCIDRRVRLSLMLLADYMAEDGSSLQQDAIRASLGFSLKGAEKAVQRLGFTIVYPTRNYPQRLHDYLEGFLIRWLMWVFHPYGVRERRPAEHVELWMSAFDLQRLYGTRSYDPASRP